MVERVLSAIALVLAAGCAGYAPVPLSEWKAWKTPPLVRGDAAPEAGFFQTCDETTMVRQVFFRPSPGAAAGKIYTHERGIDLRLGRRGRLVFINDYFATKACKVIVVELSGGRSWRIDEKAREMHAATAPPGWDPRCQVPIANALSPDGGRVLIVMCRSYGLPSSQRWSYSVDAVTGRVRRQFKTDGLVPAEWWRE